MTTASAAPATSNESPRPANDAALLERLLAEGFVPDGGPGAWHGPDFAAAIAEIDDDTAYWRPAPGRHNIAEIALHHAYYQHAVRSRLTAAAIPPFPLAGDDWFAVETGGELSWEAIRELCRRLQEELVATAVSTAAGPGRSELTPDERFAQVLGITAHAIYHAGQIQLLRRLREA